MLRECAGPYAGPANRQANRLQFAVEQQGHKPRFQVWVGGIRGHIVKVFVVVIDFPIDPAIAHGDLSAVMFAADIAAGVTFRAAEPFHDVVHFGAAEHVDAP